MKKQLGIIAIILMFLSCSNHKDNEWQTIAENLSFPEGPAFMKGQLVFSNSTSNWIGMVKDEHTDTLILFDSLDYQTNGNLFINDSCFISCEFKQGCLLKVYLDGTFRKILPNTPNVFFNRPNDICMDESGNLYFSDPNSYNPKNADGRIHYFNEEKQELVVLDNQLAFPNGIKVSSFDKKLYVCESAKERILRYTLLEPGVVGVREVFAELPGGDPDGLEIDRDGNVYVAHFGGGKIAVFSPEGENIRNIETPGLKPSNIEFNADSTCIFITEDETDAIYKIKL